MKQECFFLTKLLRNSQKRKARKARNRNIWPGNREEMKISVNIILTRNVYGKKHAPNKRSLVEFKNEMLMCKYDAMYDAELKE